MHWLLNLDHTVTFWLYRGHLSTAQSGALNILATGFIYLLPALLVYLFFWGKWQDKINSGKIFLNVVLAWMVLNTLIGNFLYSNYGFRDRPFASMGLHELLLERPAKAFPSDHAAALLAATLAFFYYKYPKMGWLFLVGGLASAIARVAIGFHWPGDILGGWLVGVLAFYIMKLLDGPVTKLLAWFLGLFGLRQSEEATNGNTNA